MMDDKLLINALIIMAGIESKQSGAMPLEDNPLFVAANRLKELDALKAQVEQLKNELTLSTDQNDLLLDEFVRVKLLTDNEEIHGLCERAHVRMRQKVSVIDRNFKQAEEIKRLKSQVEKLKERNRKLDVDLLRALFYAPSSPVSAQKAQEIEVWYGKFKQVVLAAKAGE